jgi:uncharacterized membrane protein YccC
MTHKTLIIILQLVAAGFGAAAAIWLIQHHAPIWLFALIIGWGMVLAFVAAFRESRVYEKRHRDE